MRSSSLVLAGLVTGSLIASAAPSQAGGAHWGRTYAEDPYAYSFTLPRYYPYYNSGYWVPRQVMRYRYRYDTVLPPYQSSWGHPLKVHVPVEPPHRSVGRYSTLK